MGDRGQCEMFATDGRVERSVVKPKLDVRSEIQRRESKHAPLRALLADGRWHDMHELVRVGGNRFGARLLELRRGEDGGPQLTIEKRLRHPGLWEYRAVAGVAGGGIHSNG